MKKLLLIVGLVIFIPYLIVTIFINEEEIKFIYGSNMYVRVLRNDTGKIDKVPFEDYVVGVLAGEMPISFELEALKAQALAARSYVMKKMAYNYKKEYDVVDTVLNQVYLDDEYLKKAWGNNYTEKINKMKTAVLETKGEYIAYDNQVIEAFFFSTSAGNTENSEDVFINSLPYLRSVESKWDSEVSPVFNDYEVFTKKQFYEKLNLNYNENLNIEIVSQTKNGLVQKIKINGSILTGNSVVAKLKLRSNYFTISEAGDNINISTRGYGHGVGMSQYGALGMAKEGYKYDEIIKHYYQGVEIKKI